MWLENGPLRLKAGNNGWTIDINEHSWHRAPAFTLYVDQPVGTGLSFSREKNWCNNDVSRELSLLLLVHLDDMNFTHRFPYRIIDRGRFKVDWQSWENI